MIQELTDCGPSRTYPVYYLEDAMNNLGDCFDYAVNDYGAEGSEVAELFCLSGVAREFERGNAWVVSGKSGVELFALIAERSGYQSRPILDRLDIGIPSVAPRRVFRRFAACRSIRCATQSVLPLARSLGGTRGSPRLRYGEKSVQANQTCVSKKEAQENPTRPGIRIGCVTPLNPNVRAASEKHQ